jgi:hypothetical protein
VEESWRLDEGPDWDRHRQAVEPNLARFEQNFRSVRWVLERDPYAFTEPLHEQVPEQRVFTTRDFMQGFELVVFFEVFEINRSCELRWVKLRPLGQDEELWGT